MDGQDPDPQRPLTPGEALAVPDLERPMTPGEALEKLFMANADNGRNAANDDLMERIVQRLREIPDMPPGP